MITMQNVRKTYGNFTFEISMELPEGQILGLIGKNGAGKSTLLNVVCGFLPPDYGSLSRGGMTIGYLPYEHPLYRHLTVLENLRYFYRCFHGKNLDLQDAAVQEVLQALSIDYLNQRMDQCSSGQEQKAGIACILLSNADMIIMDEPSAPLTEQETETLHTIVRQLKGKGITIIYILICSFATNDIPVISYMHDIIPYVLDFSYLFSMILISILCLVGGYVIEKYTYRFLK